MKVKKAKAALLNLQVPPGSAAIVRKLGKAKRVKIVLGKGVVLSYLEKAPFRVWQVK